jgi:quinol-cytochrome oxidoreductase complex cytochrome b subunit
MLDEQEPHSSWEMAPSTKRKFTIGVAVVFFAVAFLNVVSEFQSGGWQQPRLFQTAGVDQPSRPVPK